MTNINIKILKEEFINIKKSNTPVTIKLIYIFSILIPILLITGPFLADLSVCIIGTLFIFFTINQKGKNIQPYKKYIYFFLILYLILVTSAINSSFYQHSLKIFFYIRFFIYFLAIVFLINKFKKYQFVFFQILKILLYILIFDSFFQYLFGFNILGISPITMEQGIAVTSFFGDEKILGSYLIRIFPIFIYLYYLNKKKKVNLTYINFLSIVIIIITILSYERIATFFSLITFFFLFIFNYINYKKKKIFIILILILLGIFSTNFNNSHNRIIHTKQQLVPNEHLVFFSSTHQNYAISSLEIFKKNILFGSGPKTFLLACEDIGFSWKKDECNIHPHNIALQVLSEVGLLGIIFYLYLLILFVKIFIRFLIKNDERVFLIISIFIFLNPFFPNGNLFNNWFNVINWIAIPFIFARRNDYKLY